MKKGLLFLCVMFLFSLFFVNGAFCQTLSDSEAEELLIQERATVNNGETNAGIDIQELFQSIQSQTGVKGRSTQWYSNNPNDFVAILGSKWKFTYTISSTYNDEITFGNTTTQLSGNLGLDCTDPSANFGAVFYTELPANLGGGYGYAASVTGYYLDDYYFFKVSGGVATGYYMYQVKSSGRYSSIYSMTGIRISGPTGNNSTNPPPVDTSTCKIMAKSMTIDSSTIPTTNDTVKFTVSAISDCSIPLYYYYSYAPNYGTDDYDQNSWVKVLDGTGFTASNTFSQKFTNPGYYVVVAWISPKMGLSNPINMIGSTVAVKPATGN